MTSNCQAKPRNISSPSERGVPDDSPKWAINPTYVLRRTHLILSLARMLWQQLVEFEESACSSLPEEDLDLVYICNIH